MSFENKLDEKIRLLTDRLKGFLPQCDGEEKLLSEAMEYSLMAGGKRLRPLLVTEIYSAMGGSSGEIMPLAAALEMIHTYSLVHDDLPAMDDDEYRRGKKTTHIVYGEANAILCGDALLNRSMEVALQSFEYCKPEDSQRVVRALQYLFDCSGIHGMIGGQVLDLRYEEEAADLQTLTGLHEMKTGALIRAAFVIPALVYGAEQSVCDRLEECGRLLGLAFQIQDDILDRIGDEAALGKPIHSDEKNGKSTFASLLGLEEAGNRVAGLSGQCLQLLRELPFETVFLEELAEWLIHRTW
ncbi:MAG: farnesyl diphosphate synthase [Lachnospiraceae bacterium]|nr:polyprenyl synthetase family protein [Lachnospiraceae bacterium]MDY5742323.1 farnesyl diphosphate synthase [Lachnospiraceae bacterium]